MPPPAQTLLDRADARWRTIAASSPDLIPAIDIQRRMVARTLAAVRTLEETGLSVVEVDLRQTAAKLAEGIPVFRGESWTPPVELLGPLVVETCNDLAAGAAGAVAANVRACLDGGRIDIGSLLAASLDRNQTAIRSKAVHENIAPDVLWLAAELAAAPAAYIAQCELNGPTAPATELQRWPYGYCPSCGSWPAFAETVDSGTRFRCSFCGHGWRAGSGCCYCGAGSAEVTWLKEHPAATRRALACGGCGGYLKHLFGDTAIPFGLMPLEDLASTPLDLLAAQQGLGRPPLPELGGPERYPCDP